MSSRILLVEDHQLLVQSLTLALSEEGFEVRGVIAQSPEHVLAEAAEFDPRLVLLDYDLGRAGLALPLVAPLRERGAEVLVVTGSDDRAALGACVEAGALGVILKSQPFADLVAAVRETAELRAVMSGQQRDDLLAELRRQRAADRERLAPFARMTAAERDVLAALMDGRSAEAIAAERFVSVSTVRSQIRAILRHLGVSSQLEAVAEARRAGWTAD